MKLLRKRKNKLYCLRVITSLAAGTGTAVTRSFAERRASFSRHETKSLAATAPCAHPPHLSRCVSFSKRRFLHMGNWAGHAGAAMAMEPSLASWRDVGGSPEQPWCFSRWHCESHSAALGLFCSKRYFSSGQGIKLRFWPLAVILNTTVFYRGGGPGIPAKLQPGSHPPSTKLHL